MLCFQKIFLQKHCNFAKNVRSFALLKLLTFFFSENIPYFFGYKAEIFSFQNNPKDLDPSWKMDLDLCDCLGRVKLVL